MRKIYFLLTMLFLNKDSMAQVFLEAAPVGTTFDGALIIYNSHELSNRIPYSNIRGDAFWKNAFYEAHLYAANNQSYGKHKVRINLMTHEINFLDKNNIEKTIVPGLIRKVVVYDSQDNGKILTVFRKDIEEMEVLTKNKNCYVQEMNQGRCKLLKITMRKINTADSLFGTLKRYYFSSVNEYFLQVDKRIQRIKKLNRDNIFAFLPTNSTSENWASDNKIDFTQEEDAVYFLNYFNSLKKE